MGASLKDIRALIRRGGRRTPDQQAQRDRLGVVLATLICETLGTNRYATTPQYRQFVDAWGHEYIGGRRQAERWKQIERNTDQVGMHIEANVTGSDGTPGRKVQRPIVRQLAEILACSVRTIERLAGGKGSGYPLGTALYEPTAYEDWTDAVSHRWLWTDDDWRQVYPAFRPYWITDDGDCRTNIAVSGAANEVDRVEVDDISASHVETCRREQIRLRKHFRRRQCHCRSNTRKGYGATFERASASMSFKS